MSVFSNHTPDLVPGEVIGGNTPAILDKNWQTTAAVTIGVATGGVTGALMLSVFPAQTLAVGGTIGALAVAGDRRSKGEDPIFGLLSRFDKKSEEKTESDVKADVKSAA